MVELGGGACAPWLLIGFSPGNATRVEEGGEEQSLQTSKWHLFLIQDERATQLFSNELRSPISPCLGFGKRVWQEGLPTPNNQMGRKMYQNELSEIALKWMLI
jgi:hypothetical protein